MEKWIPNNVKGFRGVTVWSERLLVLHLLKEDTATLLSRMRGKSRANT